MVEAAVLVYTRRGYGTRWTDGDIIIDTFLLLFSEETDTFEEEGKQRLSTPHHHDCSTNIGKKITTGRVGETAGGRPHAGPGRDLFTSARDVRRPKATAAAD